MATGSRYNGLEIAVIGMSARFPFSSDYNAFWDNLAAGKELIGPMTEEECHAMGVTEAEWKDEQYIKEVPVLENKGMFDHHFFGYTAEEAAWMDPQTRMFHEQCWKALEDAGYAAQTGRIKIGLFAGASGNNNWKLYAFNGAKKASLDPFYLGMIADAAYMPTLISYKLNLRGPSCYINTACSTSLVAVHQACRSLITRDCIIALAGGISAGAVRKKGYHYQEGMILSKDGHCRAFDATASGTIPGEGAGVVVLKRLADALNDGDHIHAVIRATAVNNDGSNKIGYTAPGVNGQADCIAAAHKLAGIDPRAITYIETHGTGTRLGDPVEIRALNQAFATGGNEKFCAIGSVKTNMGHTDAAAGVAGLIKTILALQHKQLPPSLHYSNPNPEIEFQQGPFYVNDKLTSWATPGKPLCAGISSFGIGGTNAHVIVEEAPATEKLSASYPAQTLCLSAKNPVVLDRYIQSLKEYVQNNPDLNLSDLAYSLQAGRKDFLYRKSGAFTNRESLLDLLGNKLPAAEPERSSAHNNEAVFLFPGQGTQYAGMCSGLWQQHPFIREQLNKGFDLVQQLTGNDLRNVLFGEQAEQINSTVFTQPLLFIAEHAMASWLLHTGIKPACMIGHSIGEYVAACIAGVFTYEDALKIVVKRAALMNSLPGGAMVSLQLDETTAGKWVNEGISIAAVNAPGQVVLSGDFEAVASLIHKLEAAEIPFVKLQTSHAFHSSMMDKILPEFEAAFRGIVLQKPKYPFVANLTGKLITEEEATSPAYWSAHLRHPVLFSAGVQTILSQYKGYIFIEAGPGRTLSGLVARNQTDTPLTSVQLLPGAQNAKDDILHLAIQTGKLWNAGLSPDWMAIHAFEKRKKIPLPVYSFEQVEFPAEVNPFAGMSSLPVESNGTTLKDWVYFQGWRRSVHLPDEKNVLPQTWVCCTTGNAYCNNIIKGLQDRGDTVIQVFTGNVFTKSNRHSYTINSTDPDYTRLFNEITADGISITGMIYGWGMQEQIGSYRADGKTPPAETVFLTATEICKAFLNTIGPVGKKVVILTATAHRVTGNEECSPVQSLLLGILHVLPQEYGVLSSTIDIDKPVGSSAQLHAIVNDICELNPKQDRIIAYRNGQRWIQEYQRNQVTPHPTETRFKKGGVYLITGGLGNLGYLLCRHLLKNFDAILLLTGRKPVPAVTNGKTEQDYPEYLQRLNTLKEAGNEVHYFSLNIGNKKQLTRLVDEAEAKYGKIDGIIHAAGVFDASSFELLEDITTENVRKLFGPKISGIENIYELFHYRSPDFMIAVSSVSTVLAGLGFAAYSAANIYMEQFVAAHCSELPYWKTIGLAELAFTETDAKENPRAMGPSTIVSLFQWGSSLEGVQLLTSSTEDLYTRIHKAYYSVLEKRPESGNILSQVKKQERPAMTTEYTAAVTPTEKRVQEIFEEFFSLQRVGTEDSFFELGGDSLKAMILLKKIKNEFSVIFTLQDFLVKTTIRDIAAKIDEVAWFTNGAQMENEITV